MAPQKRPADRVRVIRCIVCGKETKARRRSALYCSDACKQRQYRERRKVQEE